MKPIKEYKLSSSKQAAYIPILDAEPSFAAKFLTKKDLNKSYELLREVFKEVNTKKPYHLPLYETILNSRYNFMWFVNFFKQIEKLLKIQKYRIDFKRCPKEEGDSLELYQPFKVVYKENGVVLREPRANVKDQTPINNYRVQYIMAEYGLEDFQDEQYPGWYLLKDTTIFEQYNEKTNTRIKIEFRNGRFYYFIAGASDNWLQIEDVPQAMDHIISAFLFRNVMD